MREQPEKKTGYYQDGSVWYERYCIDGKYHRVEGPADIGYYQDGSVWYERYCIDGKLHKVDGPAHIYYYEDGSVSYEEYLIDGRKHTKEEHMFKMNQLNAYQVEDLAVLLLDPDEETRNIAKKLLRPNLKISLKSMTLDDLTEAWEATPKSTAYKKWEESINELLEDLHERETHVYS